MSPPTAAAQPTGHAARAVISTERRLQIWNQFYISFKETIPPFQWCTKQELVDAACSGKTGVKFTVDELTEVIRGRKHKREAGIDSQKVNGGWHYRFIPPGRATSQPSPKPLSASPPSAKTKSKAKPKAKSKTTPSKIAALPKTKAPARPRAKSPAAKTPPPSGKNRAGGTEKVVPPSSASRKRGSPSPSAKPATTRLLSASKKPRTASPRTADEGSPSDIRRDGDPQSERGDDRGAWKGGGLFSFGGGARVSDDGGEGERGGWNCAVM